MRRYLPRVLPTQPSRPTRPTPTRASRRSRSRAVPAPSADGGVVAGGAGGIAAGLALLAAALSVIAPRLSRRIHVDVIAPRPFAFVALLKRPG